MKLTAITTEILKLHTHQHAQEISDFKGQLHLSYTFVAETMAVVFSLMRVTLHGRVISTPSIITLISSKHNELGSSFYAIISIFLLLPHY
jgi:hypothetical protein